MAFPSLVSPEFPDGMVSFKHTGGHGIEAMECGCGERVEGYRLTTVQ
jgi:hypothetical protein